MALRDGAGQSITTLVAERGKKSGDKKILKTKVGDSWIRSSGAVRRRDAICWHCLVCLNEFLTSLPWFEPVSRASIVTLKRLYGQEGDCIYRKSQR